ncbi:hypothetical protein [Streptomyces sp. DG1A-41]|uniref:hypothetical protein n=1 Tax=Streptomyces sp. DG1A-41 TaxID=3125779 RepID=UPI0030D12E25
MPQQVCVSQRRFGLTAPSQVSTDAWDGYRAKDDFDDPRSSTVGAEFHLYLIAGGGTGTAKPAGWETYRT